MITEVYMPKNGMDMTEGTLVRWLKNVGERVEKDEPIMEIETDKVTMESESPASGVLLKRVYEDGAVVPVLTTLGYIGEAGEAIPDGAAAPAEQPATPEKGEASAATPEKAACAFAEGGAVAATPYAKTLAQEYGVALEDVTPSGTHGEVRGRDVEKAAHSRVRATPLARAASQKLGVELSALSGSGFGGKIVKDDVLGAAAPAPASVPAAAPAPAAQSGAGKVPMNAMRRVIAKRMLASHTEIPPVTTCVKVDVTDLLAMREQINAGREKADKVSINDLIIMATCKTLQKNERFRMSFTDEGFLMHEDINIGVAVGLDDGLIVPVLHNVDRKTITQIAREAKELAAKARKGTLKPDETGGGCITISNLGMFGTYCFTPIINQPEASIIGVCDIEDELALVNGAVVVRKKTILCTTYDHRIVNGVEASKFQADLKALLENPVQIII